MRRHLIAAGLAATLIAAHPAGPAHAAGSDRSPAPFTLALLGDTPYGDAQRAAFPALVDAVNADPQVSLVLHAGDIKSGSASCDDARFADLRRLYDTFADPFVLTPGDNDWTDCHRTAAGGYLPTERLEALRRVFFPRPGRTIGGRPAPVLSQAVDPRHGPYRENVLFVRAGVVFSTVHVVGSENDLEPWAQLPGGDRPQLRQAEFEQRRAAALSWIDTAFTVAQRTGAPGVLLLMQAEPTATPGFADIRARIAERAAAYRKPVLLVHGDEHLYEVERQYAGVANLTRLETFGDTASHWLRLTVDPGATDVFGWTPQTVPAPPAPIAHPAG